MRIFDPRLTQEIATEICRRSAEGEGVLAIIVDMGLPGETLDWLKEQHHGAVVAAKQEQIRRKAEA